MNRYTGKSIISVLQLYSDNVKTSLKVSGLRLYPLHIKFMNFAEHMQAMMCSHGHTMLAFLTLEFMHMIKRDYLENCSLERLTRLNNVHNVIAEVLKPLWEKLLVAFIKRTGNKELYD